MVWFKVMYILKVRTNMNGLDGVFVISVNITKFNSEKTIRRHKAHYLYRIFFNRPPWLFTFSTFILFSMVSTASALHFFFYFQICSGCLNAIFFLLFPPQPNLLIKQELHFQISNEQAMLYHIWRAVLSSYISIK